MFAGTDVGILIPEVLENEYMLIPVMCVAYPSFHPLLPDTFLGLLLFIDAHFHHPVQDSNLPVISHCHAFETVCDSENLDQL